ncbi:helix-turn-helix domain-containing protein [Micromonospora wenchangensis]|uniref:helix-turn-helix domain-containing protein n=1 Tax=Micromonospora wenchangensis TaxID=1185415 RepID=UPI003D72BE2C
MDSSGLLPVGRRVAYWRGRRRLSQQVFADRLGKSKSWVDKIERGVRTLDKVSTLQDIAAVLRIDPAVLLGRDTRPAEATGWTADVTRIRVALSRYDIPLARPAGSRPVPPAGQVARQVAHAWTTFQHASYPQVVALLPELLADAERAHAADPAAGREPLVETYRVTASLLVKLAAPELAWLAVDRAMSTATDDPVLVAAAAVQLGQVLRASGGMRVAQSAMLAAAYRIAPPVIGRDVSRELSLCGTLLLQAALAAATHGDDAAVAGLLDEADDLATFVGDGHDHHRTGFGPTAVAVARAATAVELGDAHGALARHEEVTRRDGWRWLPVEHRAAYLVDADRIAPAEIRHRPAGREALARVAREPDAPTALVRLAATLGVG